MARLAESTISGIQARQLNSALGAEVRGVDIRKPMDDETFRAVHGAWMKHLVLVFPDQHVTATAINSPWRTQDFVRKARISVAIVAKRASGRVHIFRKSWPLDRPCGFGLESRPA